MGHQKGKERACTNIAIVPTRERLTCLGGQVELPKDKNQPTGEERRSERKNRPKEKRDRKKVQNQKRDTGSREVAVETQVQKGGHSPTGR